MERKTRSGKAPAAPSTAGKRGRKKKSDIVETESVSPVTNAPARRSTRGRNSTQLISEPELETSFNVENVSLEPSSSIEVILPLDPNEVELNEAVEENALYISEVSANTLTPDALDNFMSSTVEHIPMSGHDVEMNECAPQSDWIEENFVSTNTTVQFEEPSDDLKATESIDTLEQKMNEVLLEESSDQILVQKDPDISVKDEVLSEYTSPADPHSSETLDERLVLEDRKTIAESTEVNQAENPDAENCEEMLDEIKGEVIEKAVDPVSSEATPVENPYDFMDIEDDAPFVRRSRRLQSIHIEQVPIKIESQALNPVVTLGSQSETNVVCSDTPSETTAGQLESKREVIVKPQDIMMDVDQFDERLKRFEIIRDNIFLKKSDKKVCKVNKTMKCDCTITEEDVKSGELGCQYNCINRLLYIECGQKCRCGEYCDNQQFQRYNYSECTVFDTVSKGFGIRAVHDIPAETFIIEYVGEVLDNKQFEKRAKKYSENKNIHYYFMALKSNAIIDATKKGNISRFINHSCDPNAETQKWTVNGELRVGFFSRKDIKAGEEITFDYQYQRYGKEAQKCYCEAVNCRGWIGENPLDDEEEEAVESPEIDDSKPKKTKARKVRKSKATSEKLQPELEIKDDPDSDEEAKKIQKKREAEEKAANRLKKRQAFEDLEIEGEINDLTESGLKNRNQTIRLSRLVVRAKNTAARSRLLKILFTGDLPCCRLFLDYNGLKLLHQWMVDLNVKSSIPDLELAIEVMKAFEILPITNKTVLRTSKVLDRVEKWKNLDLESKRKTKEEKQMTKEERKQMKAEKKKNKGADKSKELSDQEATKAESLVQPPTEENKENSDLALASDENAIDELTALKMRVRQVASELLEKWEALKEDFKIPKKQKQEIMIEHEREADDWEDDSAVPRGDALRVDRYKNRFGDDSGQSAANRSIQAPYKKPLVSKQERRQIFEMKVAQIDTEKRMGIIHENNCQIFGLTPLMTHPLDVPVRVNRVTGEYNTIDGRVVPPPPNHYQFKYEPLTLSTNPDDYHLPPINLPDHWQFAIDVYGRIYYYHEKIRQAQWEAPIKILPLKIEAGNEIDSPDSDESTTETEDSEEEELKALLEMLKRKKVLPPVQPSAPNPLIFNSGEGEEDDLEKKIMSNMLQNPVDQPLKFSQVSQKRIKKKRHGLASMQFIRPRTEADKIYGRSESKRYKEVKEKLRQKKRRILKGEAEPGDDTSEDDDVPLDESIGSRKFVDELDILELNKQKREAEKKMKKQKPAVDQAEAKRQFRNEMIREITKYLQPFSEDSCENGKITSDVDFSSLVNKLTFSVLTKETKHCQQTNSVLKATDSVKAKTKEYIKKYMGKFNGPYVRKEDEQDYAVILNKF